MKDYLAERLRAALGKADITLPDMELQFEKPKMPEHGDIATNIAMVLAKLEKINPRELAGLIVNNLELDETIISSVEIAGPGFINFRFAVSYLREMLRRIVETGRHYGKSDINAGKTVNVEWVSANPTGPLHAGHGRQVCLGATICSLLEWTGWDVTREYYFNNAGNQMLALAASVRERYLELFGKEPDPEQIQYVGDYIRDIAQSIADEFGDAKMDADPAFFQKIGEEWCFSVIKSSLTELGIHHDIFFNEDSLYKEGKIEEVLNELRAKDLAYERDGAVWLRTTEFGSDKDRVVMKSTGEPTYRLPDIAYHREKIKRGYDKLIDIFGADHIATYPDVLAGVRALGLSTDHVDVIIHQMVSFVNKGEAVKMSKRSGNVYYLNDLIRDVGPDAVRFFFVMRSANAHLEFDIKLAQEQSENNPVYYLQYAHARIASILRFAEMEGFDTTRHADLELLGHPAEITLVKALLEFPDVVLSCAASYETQHICTYLHNVATAFHKFYHECRVVTEQKELSHARLHLCKATKQVLANGFEILGVNAPERM